MKLLGKICLENFTRRHADARSTIKAWKSEVEGARWHKPEDVKRQYAPASFLADNRIVFNIKGNHYRIVVKVNYKQQSVLVTHIGTHAEYNSWRLK